MLIVFLGIVCLLHNAEADNVLIQECPTLWYKNMMPSIGDEGSSGSQHFQFADGRRETDESVDVAWVKANCKIKMENVY